MLSDIHMTADSTSMPTFTGRQRMILCLILGLALGARLAYVLTLPTSFESLADLPDQLEYLALGRNLLEHQELSFIDPRFADTVYAFRTPIYPTFIALCGAKSSIIRIAQTLIDTSSVLAVFLLTARLLSSTPSRDRFIASSLASVFVAFSPFLVHFTGLILTETLFTAFLVWGVYLFVRAGSRPASLSFPKHFVLPGLLIALSILLRPSAALLPVVMGMSAIFLGANLSPDAAYHRHKLSSYKAICSVAATMGLLTVVVLFPWAWRNHARLGQWIWTTTNSGFTAYDGFNPRADGSSNQWFTDDPSLATMTETQRNEYLNTQARTFIRENPGRSLYLALLKVARTWSPVPLSNQYGNRLVYFTVGLAFTVPYYLLILAGLWKSPLARSAKAFLVIPAIYFTVIHALSVGSLRYRIPSEPPMAPLAGIACVKLLTKIRSPRD
jgi:4-amino-4-deoxy-L-arabinose transferase-like glycosyltransferase